jgi:hypothetical protein
MMLDDEPQEYREKEGTGEFLFLITFHFTNNVSLKFELLRRSRVADIDDRTPEIQ